MAKNGNNGRVGGKVKTWNASRVGTDQTNEEGALKSGEGHGTSYASNKVKMSTTNFVEGTTNSKRDESPCPDDSKADRPSKGKTKLNVYQTPSQTKHTWHKSVKDKKTSKYISERSWAREYVEKNNETLRTYQK